MAAAPADFDIAATVRRHWDTQLRFSQVLPDFDERVACYRSESDAAVARLGAPHRLAYGADPRQVLERFPAANDHSAPAIVFVHGGYWRAFEIESYRFVASGFHAAGHAVWLLEYRLMPTTPMGALVDDVGRGLRAIGEFEDRPVVLVGHSAGAHLAVSALTPNGAATSPAVKTVIAVSGIYDLTPVRRCFLQEEIRLSADDARRWSPLSFPAAPAVPVLVAVGGNETPEFKRQAIAYAGHLEDLEPGRHGFAEIDGAHHMGVVAQLGDHRSPLIQAITRWARRSVTGTAPPSV